MKTLKSIRLQNFQSHKDTLIHLAGPGCLTVITGPSDSGKSAIIRALRWVFYNVPQGDGFITVGQDKCSVSLIFDDGTKVERIRSRGGVNRYVLNGQTYEGFGNGVPLEVQQATGIRKLEIGEQNFLLNLSEQLDGLFLGKSVSGPARAKVLGKLAGTEEIDYAGKEIGTDLYRAKRQQEGLEKDVVGLDEQIGRFGYIPSWEHAASQAEAVLADTRDKIIQIEKLKNLQAVWKDLTTKITALEQVIDGLQTVDVGLDLVRKAQEDLSAGNALAKIHASHLQAVCGCEQTKTQVKQLSTMIEAANPLLDKVTMKHDEATQYRDLSGRCESELMMVSSLTQTVRRLAGIEKTDNQLREAWNQNLSRSTLQSLSERHEQSSLAALSLKRVLATLGGIDGAENVLKQVQGDNTRRSLLQALYDQYEGPKLSALSLSLKVRNFPDVERAEERLKQAEDGSRQLDRLRKARDNRSDSIQLVAHSERLIDMALSSVNKFESEYVDLMLTVGKCPTCGSEIDIEKLREVI